MTATRTSFSHKYVGLSTDVKPVTGGPDADGNSLGTIPVGSVFHETDTGNIATYDGYVWRITDREMDSRVLDRLDAIIEQLKALNDLHSAVADSL
jgi:hypothetical protein